MLARHSFLCKTIRRWVSNFTVIAIGRLGVCLIALFTCCYIYGSKIEPNWIQVISIPLTIPSLSPAFEEFKIVQISDLHANRFMTDQRMEKMIRLVNQQQPDAIAITGDIITKHKGFNGEKLEDKLSKLISQEATLAVLGNHDHWGNETDKLKQALGHSNIINLDNEVYVIERGREKLTVAGVDDPYWGKPNLEKVIAQLPTNSTNILLVHEPDYIQKIAKTHKFDLQLSGHSHGGQIRVPFLDPLFLPPGGRKYFAGLNRVQDTMEYTNRGLGMTGLPFRFNSRPEITVFTLHAKTSNS